MSRATLRRAGHALAVDRDRRPELRELRDLARAQGDTGGAARWQRALEVETVRLATRAPSTVVGW